MRKVRACIPMLCRLYFVIHAEKNRIRLSNFNEQRRFFKKKPMLFGHPITYFAHSFFILLVDSLFLSTIACPTFEGSQECSREVCVPMHETHHFPSLVTMSKPMPFGQKISQEVLVEVSFLFGRSFASESIKHRSLDYLKMVVQYSRT